MPENNDVSTTTNAIVNDEPRVMEGLDTHQPTELQADQYAENASNIDADKPVGMTGAPPGVPPAAPHVPVAPNARQDVQQFGQQAPSVQAPKQNQPNPATTQKAPPQVTQKASWIHDIAQTLAGGPRYNYTINPETGEMEKRSVPVSGKHLAMAIALEAIGGATTGLAYGKGAGNTGKGGAAAFQQGEQAVKEQDEQQRKQASDDYARQAAIADTNMKMLHNEQISSQADEQLQQQDVDAYSDEYNELQKGGFIKQDNLSSDDVKRMLADKTLNVTQDMLVPYKVVQSVGPDGQTVKTIHGAPKWEKRFALTSPLAEITPSKELLDKAYENKLPGFYNPNTGEKLPLPNGIKLRAHTVSGLQETLRNYGLNDSAIDNATSDREHTLHSGTSASAQPQGQQAQGEPTKPSVQIKDPKVADLADNAAKSHDLPADLMRAVVNQESSGNINAPNSKPNKSGVYAVGPFQVTLDTARTVTGNSKLTEAELKDPETNADIAGKYMRNLLDTHDGSVHDALVAYHGKGADSGGVTGEAYAKQVMARMPGITAVDKAGEAPAQQDAYDRAISAIPVPDTPMHTSDAISKGLITRDDIKTLSQFGGAPTLLDGKWSSKDMQTQAERNPKMYPPESVGRLINWLGPTIDYKHDVADTRTRLREAGIAAEKAGEIAENKDKRAELESDKTNAYLAEPDGYKFNAFDHPENMSPGELKHYFETKGIKAPPELAAFQGVANYEVDPSEAAQKLYAHQIKMDRQQVMSYIKQFINPNYSEDTWKAKVKFAEGLASSQPNADGGVLRATDRATQHLGMLEEAANMMNNGQFKDINQVKNWLAAKTGGSAPNVFDSIAQIAGAEVAKVAGGGAPHQTELDELRKRLNNANSPQQIYDTINSYMNLMYGANEAINQKVQAFYKKDIPQVTPTPITAKMFGLRGHYVPGYGWPVNMSNGQLGFTTTGKLNDAVTWSKAAAANNKHFLDLEEPSTNQYQGGQ